VRYIAGSVEESLVSDQKMAFIAGPRQVGKTTLARALLPDPAQNYFNWDVDSHRRKILRDPEGFWSGAAKADGHRPRIVLDEIHKYPRWKRFLKGLYDARKDDVEILVTGSGRLDVYQKGGDSLLGRYALARLHPFTAGEILARGRQTILPPAELLDRASSAQPIAGAREALALVERFTGFPEPVFAATERRLLRWRRSRRQLVLREDLRDLSRIRDVGLVDQLVSILPERIGSPLSVNALRETLQVAFETVQGWLRALERLYFLFEIRPFAGRMARTLRREGKIYLFDHTEIDDPGPRFENLVALHLLKLVDAWNDLGHGDFALHYVRDKEKREVDFLVTDRRRPYLLVEAKLSQDDVSASLRYFRERLSPRRTFQVVRQGDPRTSGGIVVLPAERFLALI
jgi:predicted AAA+ superfamily ATPase